MGQMVWKNTGRVLIELVNWYNEVLRSVMMSTRKYYLSLPKAIGPAALL